MSASDLILWGIALVVGIILGIAGLMGHRSRRSQNQKATDGSTAIQSGRDTKISDK